MNWFWFSIIALVCWSGSDLFSKIGCYREKDKTAYLKMVVAVGVVMGLHAACMILFKGVVLTWQVVWTYLPVSLLYIVSMALGYIGLRYIELSISSPICNSSGALVAVICLLMGALSDLSLTQRLLIIGAIALICGGVTGLGIVEAREDDVLRQRRQEHANRRYAKSWLALCLPIAYCLLDAAGTYADSVVLERLSKNPTVLGRLIGAPGVVEAMEEESIKEIVADSANVAYELTFLAAGIGCLAYLLIRREKFFVKQEAPKYVGACFETVGQLFYIYALADEKHVAMAAPIISAYCALSVVWSRIFLREKLSWKHYLMIGLVFIGIIILGVFDDYML